MHPKRILSISRFAGVLALSLVLWACGSGDTEATSSTDAEVTTTSSVATTDAPDTTTTTAETTTTEAETTTTEAETTTTAAETTTTVAETTTTTEAETTTTVPLTTTTVDSPDGGALYAANCANCHGASGGGGRGPSLVGIAAIGDDVIRETIINGPGAMPAFGNRLSPTEIDAVVVYISTTF